MDTFIGIAAGLLLWFLIRVILLGIYTVDQNERAVKTIFGRAERLPGEFTTLDVPNLADSLLLKNVIAIPIRRCVLSSLAARILSSPGNGSTR